MSENRSTDQPQCQGKFRILIKPNTHVIHEYISYILNPLFPLPPRKFSHFNANLIPNLTLHSKTSFPLYPQKCKERRFSHVLPHIKKPTPKSSKTSELDLVYSTKVALKHSERQIFNILCVCVCVCKCVLINSSSPLLVLEPQK